MLEDRKTWDECATECPGMNKGRVWSFEEIQENRKKYDENKPLHKEDLEDELK